ncbi:hypothetical protein V6N12_068245 [Hibiscus sabdariffa]|uniref:Uncharacterized protein n=1 Tax=Hibiscus sabdariffa TaxID=183260 RepID=A0ABR2FPP6_9ROSI
MSLTGDGSAKRGGWMAMTLADGALFSLKMWVVALVLPPNVVVHGGWCRRIIAVTLCVCKSTISDIPYTVLLSSTLMGENKRYWQMNQRWKLHKGCNVCFSSLGEERDNGDRRIHANEFQARS